MRIRVGDLRQALREAFGNDREYPSMDAGGPADLGDWVREYPEDEGRFALERDDDEEDDDYEDEYDDHGWREDFHSDG